VSPDPTAQTGEQGAGASAGSAAASEEERARAAYEAELSKISSADMMLQATVSLLNIGARRLAPAEGGAEAASAQPEGSQADPGAAGAGAPAQRDLEQVRDAIDGVSALLGILERRIPETLGPLRDALAQLQLAYAREVKVAQADADQAGQQSSERGADSPAGGSGDQKEQAGKSSPEDEAQRRGPGPAEASGRLWVPGR
jgi:hypothetical protein